MRITSQKEQEYVVGLQTAKDQFSFKEEEYKSQIRALRSAQQVSSIVVSYTPELQTRLGCIPSHSCIGLASACTAANRYS